MRAHGGPFEPHDAHVQLTRSGRRWSSDELESTLSGTYARERELGGDGQSKVFLARELVLDRAVVIKVLPPDDTVPAR